jgi:D-beta-D-heptose 7-phosphate kinase/D-beta-D-heptose 1-phosphate adenosyltransferase
MARSRRSAVEKVLALDTLLERLPQLRVAGRRIVFTNGCFDLLHVGHLHLFESAAALGDCLVCGINDDRSVRELKGPTRPVVPFAERARMLAGLEAVDFVVGFGDPTPLKLIEAIRPDVLIKGSDWPVDQIVGRDVVEAHGGRVEQVQLLPGRSTTKLLDRLRSSLEKPE